jgi:para-nitrobenzyl esterase
VKITMKRQLIAVACATLLACVSPAQQEYVVETTDGRLRGQVQDDVVAFRGIPFAAPPVGELRWRAPQPPAAWDGIRDALEFGPGCPQGLMPGWDSETLVLAEDCLYLNVWAPSERGEELLPVMFWIHGGGFVNGRSSDPIIDGTALARNGVLVVSVNYRLGRFGFFAHPALTAEDADDGCLGNYGILDQIAALAWVRDNIEAFGGDPEQVTIFGNSAGGVSVHCLMTSPLARGLFARAIAQSGCGRSNAILPFPRLMAVDGRPSAESEGLAFAARHGIEGDGAEALAALRSLPAIDIVDGLNMHNQGSQGSSGPIVDGTVIRASTEDAYREGTQAPVPLIVGGTDADGFYPFFGGSRDQVFAPFGELRAEAEALYDPEGSGELRRYGTHADADLLFLEPARNVARQHAAHGHPAWVYRFSYVPESLRDSRIGAWHSTEIASLFDSHRFKFGQEPTKSDLQAATRFLAYWLAFARTGRPAPEGLPEWPRFDADDDVLLDFQSDVPVARPDPARDRLDLAEGVAATRGGD